MKGQAAEKQKPNQKNKTQTRENNTNPKEKKFPI
jgi:hypothetical protein